MQLFGLTIYPYGLALSASAAVCLLLAALSIHKRGMKSDTVPTFAMLALPLGLLGARLMYCLSCWSWFMDKGFLYFFQISGGGLMLYGAMAGSALAAWITGRVTGQSTARILDALAAPGALMIALSRLAEGLVAQGYGWPVGDWFSVDAFDAEEFTGMSLFHLEDVSAFERLPFAIADPMYGEYHWAVFIIEALIAFAIAFILIRTADRRPGWKAMLMVLMYAAMQCLCESLRQDAVVRWGFVRVNMIVSAVLIALILLACSLQLPDPKQHARFIVTRWVLLVLCIGVVIAMEFALEKKIVFMEAVPMDVCYFISAAACVGMILTVLPAWKRSGKA